MRPGGLQRCPLASIAERLDSLDRGDEFDKEHSTGGCGCDLTDSVAARDTTALQVCKRRVCVEFGGEVLRRSWDLADEGVSEYGWEVR